MSSIKRRGDVWRARYRAPDGKEKAKHFKKRGDAQKWLNEVTTALTTGQYVDPSHGRVTFADYYADWSSRQLWEETTTKAMDLAARSVPFGDAPLARIRPSHVEQWVKAMTVAGANGRPLQASTIKTRFNNVRNVFRAAVRDRLIATDPTIGVRLPGVARVRPAKEIPPPAAVGRLMEVADSSFATFIALCAFAGLRLGEAAAVQVKHVDFLKRTIHVRQQVQRSTNGSVDIRPPKYRSSRDVAVPPDLLERLSVHIARECPSGDQETYLFRGSRPDEPPHQNTVHYRWSQTTRRAGLTGLTLHHLRHFYASGLISVGCDVVIVQRALGHQSAKTTLDTYAHLWQDGDDRTREAARRLMEQSGLAAQHTGAPQERSRHGEVL